MFVVVERIIVTSADSYPQPALAKRTKSETKTETKTKTKAAIIRIINAAKGNFSQGSLCCCLGPALPLHCVSVGKVC